MKIALIFIILPLWTEATLSDMEPPFHITLGMSYKGHNWVCCWILKASPGEGVRSHSSHEVNNTNLRSEVK